MRFLALFLTFISINPVLSMEFINLEETIDFQVDLKSILQKEIYISEMNAKDYQTLNFRSIDITSLNKTDEDHFKDIIGNTWLVLSMQGTISFFQLWLTSWYKTDPLYHKFVEKYNSSKLSLETCKDETRRLRDHPSLSNTVRPYYTWFIEKPDFSHKIAPIGVLTLRYLSKDNIPPQILEIHSSPYYNIGFCLLPEHCGKGLLKTYMEPIFRNIFTIPSLTGCAFLFNTDYENEAVHKLISRVKNLIALEPRVTFTELGRIYEPSLCCIPNASDYYEIRIS